MEPLTEDDVLVLQFEERWWRRAGAKDVEIRNRFGLTPTRYYQWLNVLIDRPEALAAHPLRVNRLRRLRGRRRRSMAGASLP